MNRPRAGAANRVRIIGGEHRGRRLDFPNLPGLRPTADRVRETLFNWLQPHIVGARCLDLFAGSGALGLEALSRGAGHVLLVEKTAGAARRLERHLEALGAGPRAAVRHADALRLLAGPPPAPFDIVFVDPPFAAGLLERASSRLEGSDWLAPGALLYLEQDAARPWPALPANWEPHREGRAGQATFRLMRRMPPPRGP